MDFLDHAAKAFGILKDIAIGGAALLAAWVGFQGLKTWRRQLVGGKRLELAENALVAAYDVVDALNQIRNPGAFGGEGATRKAEEGETKQETERLNAQYVPIERVLNANARFDKLREYRTRCRIHFGEESVPHFDTLLRAPYRIVIAARALMRDAKRSSQRELTEEQLEKTFQRREEWEAVIWDMGSAEKPDEFRREMNAALAGLDGLLKRYTADD